MLQYKCTQQFNMYHCSFHNDYIPVHSRWIRAYGYVIVPHVNYMLKFTWCTNIFQCWYDNWCWTEIPHTYYSSTKRLMTYNLHKLATILNVNIEIKNQIRYKLHTQPKYDYNIISYCTICIRSPFGSLNITSHNVYRILLHPSSQFEPTCSSMHQLCSDNFYALLKIICRMGRSTQVDTLRSVSYDVSERKTNQVSDWNILIWSFRRFTYGNLVTTSPSSKWSGSQEVLLRI